MVSKSVVRFNKDITYVATYGTYEATREDTYWAARGATHWATHEATLGVTYEATTSSLRKSTDER